MPTFDPVAQLYHQESQQLSSGHVPGRLRHPGDMLEAVFHPTGIWFCFCFVFWGGRIHSMNSGKRIHTNDGWTLFTGVDKVPMG